MKTKKPILLTSALPYANGSIHIGHLVEYIQTDIYSRFLKLIGEDVIYCCADDAHGTAIQIKAEELGISPEELIEKVNKEHQEDFKTFHIAFDNYHSTHSKENEELSKEIYLKLKEKGLIYTKDVESFYDEKAGRFLPDRYVKGECPKCGAQDQYGDVCEVCNSTYKPVDLVNPFSTITKTTPIRKSSKHYFFKLSALTDKLKAYFKDHNFQPEIVNYLNNWLEEGLQDWDISRDGPYFGFKIPEEEDKYFYVWLDAPVGYLASCKNYCDKNGKDANVYFHGDSKMIHVIGKDIMYFHFLFWPAMLMEAGFNVPDDIIVHGFLTVNKEKMSKSRGTFLTAKDFASEYPPEYLRYYYAKVLSKKMSDLDLDFDHFVETVNAELVGNVGNLCYRALSFTNRNYESKIVDFDNDTYPVIKEILDKIEIVKEHYHNFNYNKATTEIMEISSLGNKFFQDNAPWQLKKEGKDEEAKIVCAICANIVKNLSILLSPILPVFSESLQQQLATPNLAWEDINFDIKNHTINKAEILVQKVEKKEQESFPLNLVVGEVKEAKVHPDSEKLTILQVDLKEEKPRQIVAGIQKFYNSEELPGKKIIIVSNLKKAKLGGQVSEGMLLAASNSEDTELKLLEASKSHAGDIVLCGKLPNNQAQIKYDDFAKVKMSVKDKKILVSDKNEELVTPTEAVSADVPDGFLVG